MFYLYRPVIHDRYTGNVIRWHYNVEKGWDLERWWYKLAQVCQRWRNLILGSASYLGLCLVCTNGTPVADMLADSPPLPLVIDYRIPDSEPYLNIGAEEIEEINLALEQRNRVRRIHFQITVPNLQKFILSADKEYPLLEYLIVEPPLLDCKTALIFPETFQAPRLRHLKLSLFALPMESQLFPTAVGLVTLSLTIGHPSTEFQPNMLLRWLFFMPLLERLSVFFLEPVPSEDVESQLMHTPTMTHITFPNLFYFEFTGDSTFVEALVRRMITPRLERLHLGFVRQPIFLVPSLLQLTSTTNHLKFDSVTIDFITGQILVGANFHENFVSADGFIQHVISIAVYSSPLDSQVYSVARIFDSIGQIFSTVEYLDLHYQEFYEQQNVFERTEWRRLLRPFGNVRTLCIAEELVEGVAGCLWVEDGEDPLELLPELQELRYSGTADTGDVFSSFTNARQNAGRPVTVVFRARPETPLSRSLSQSSLESSSAVTWDSEVAEAGSDLDT